MSWERITSDHPRKHTVYWNRRLPDGRRLTVGRIYNADGSWDPGGPWSWTVYGPKHHPRHPEHLATGTVAAVRAGKVAVEEAAGLR